MISFGRLTHNLREIGPKFPFWDSGFFSNNGKRLLVDLPGTGLPSGHGFASHTEHGGQIALRERGLMIEPKVSEGVSAFHASSVPNRYFGVNWKMGRFGTGKGTRLEL